MGDVSDLQRKVEHKLGYLGYVPDTNEISDFIRDTDRGTNRIPATSSLLRCIYSF